jgi:UDP-N-acetylglucosamine transferase subunit ALG13
MDGHTNTLLDGLRARRALVVASTGGHLAQAVRWHRRLGLDAESHFVTFESPQSLSLLADLPHTFVPYVAPRDTVGVARATRRLFAIHRDSAPEVVLSTGAGIALSAVPVAWRHRLPFYFLESVSRFDGPSLTGRILSSTPGVRLGTQHATWASPKWPYVGTLLDDYLPPEPTTQPSPQKLRIFVTLGTIRPYRFDRLVDRMLATLTPEDEVTWQLGDTIRENLPGDCRVQVPADEYRRLALDADVVVTHAGIGAVLDLMDLGISPVLVPRRAKHAEHVDDHQLQAAREIAARGLGLAVEADEISRDALRKRGRVRRR